MLVAIRHHVRFHVKSYFPKDSLPRIFYLESDPLSPPEGEASQGVHPLDPPFFQRVSHENYELRDDGGAPRNPAYEGDSRTPKRVHRVMGIGNRDIPNTFLQRFEGFILAILQ